MIRDIMPGLHRWATDEGLVEESESETAERQEWSPFPVQQLAIENPADELFYGGAAGGGKTGLIIGLALTQHRRSLILRREATQLQELVDQLQEFAPPGSHWRGVGYGGIMRTSDGRVVELSGVPNENDKRRFQGRPHDLKAFDEVTEFTESMVDFISGWCRTTVPGQRCRKVFTGNPPTHSEGEWVIRRFGPWINDKDPNPTMPGKLRYYSRVGNDEQEFPSDSPVDINGRMVRPQSRTFIPASLKDNPKLRDTGYADRLALLPPALRAALLEGDFGISLLDDPWQVIPTAWIRAAQARWVPNAYEHEPLTGGGFDIAYGGSDRTVYVERHGGWFGMPCIWSGAETDSGEKAAALVKQKMGTSRAPLNIDVIGYGAAAFEFCQKQKLNVQGVNFGSSANGLSDKREVLAFLNIRAYAYWQLRDALDPDIGGGMIALPPHPDLLAELAAARYELVGGKLKLEPKEDIAERLGRSPDIADAVVLANYEQPGGLGFFFKVVETR